MSSRLYDALKALPGFDFGFRRSGVLELLFGEDTADERLIAARQAGFEVERLGPERLHRLEPALTEHPAGALYYPDDGQLNPAKLGARLVRLLRSSGVKFRSRMAAAGTGRRRGRHRRRRLDTATYPRSRLEPAHQADARATAGGGTVEGVFKRAVNSADVRDIRAEMRTLFPDLAGQRTLCAWCGFRPYSEDGLPLIGRVPGQRNVWVAAGHFRKGIMLAPASGKVLADLITTGTTPYP